MRGYSPTVCMMNYSVRVLTLFYCQTKEEWSLTQRPLLFEHRIQQFKWHDSLKTGNSMGMNTRSRLFDSRNQQNEQQADQHLLIKWKVEIFKDWEIMGYEEWNGWNFQYFQSHRTTFTFTAPRKRKCTNCHRALLSLWLKFDIPSDLSTYLPTFGRLQPVDLASMSLYIYAYRDQWIFHFTSIPYISREQYCIQKSNISIIDAVLSVRCSFLPWLYAA